MTKVRKAVIPAAGLGTRLFPATKATKKEWLPVVDRDGIAKPAILLIIEEALEAGIQGHRPTRGSTRVPLAPQGTNAG
jgi:UTP--glucose-1-phosphate uridylyltransferase